MSPYSPEIEQLLRHERENALFTRRVLGYPIWGSERYAWHERNLIRAAGAEPLAAQGSARGGAMAKRVWGSLRDLTSLPALKHRDVWVLSASQYRRRDSSSTLRCLFTGELERQLGGRVLFLERNSSALPADTGDEVVYLDSLMEGFAAIASQAAKVLAPTVDADTRTAFAPIAAQRLVKSAVIGQLWDKAADLLITALKPRAVFVLCGYTRFVALQRALRRHGVPLIELQHGIIHRAHAGYTFDPAQVPDYVPDHVVVFGERFGRVLESCSSYWQGRWSVGGHGWLLDRAASSLPVEDARRGPVIVFSQPLEPVKQQLKAWLPALRAALPRDIELVLKPHPREVNAARDYGAASASGVRIESPGADSYRLLTNCRACVTVFSTLALEALAFPCQSLVVRSPLWPEEISKLVEEGILTAADSPAELAEQILRGARASETAASDLPRELFGQGTPALDYLALLDQVNAAKRLP